MIKKLFSGSLIILLVTIFMFASCTDSSTSSITSTADTETPITSVSQTQLSTSTISIQAHWWDKFGMPQYGGNVAIIADRVIPQFDPYQFMGTDYTWCYDMLFYPDWTLDRNEWSMAGSFIPEKYLSGNLAESWILTDQQTITVHLRQGVNWQNKEPVNGREFTSEDVLFHYDRLLGTGHGYSSPSPFAASMVSNMKNVTVVDKYTVQFHFKTSCGGIAFMTISDPSSVNWFEAPEWVALAGVPTTEATQAGGSEPPGEGPPADGDAGGGGPPGPPPVPTEGSSPLTTWKNVVGTGPWMLTDFVSNSSETWSKNSDYWATDPRYPQNKTPYLDSVKLLYISDVSTKVAALRTGKIDLVGGVDWQHAQTLNDTDFQKASVPIESGSGVTWRNDLAPFSDINVRKALNMAVDRQAISQSLYHGLTDDKPMGLVTQSYTGYCYSYEDWPQSLKDEYTYNPTRAKQLLADAGYPQGFKTSCINISGSDDLILIFKDYFKNIGVDVEIQDMDPYAGGLFVRAAKHDGMVTSNAGYEWAPTRVIDQYSSTGIDAPVDGLKFAPDMVIDGLSAKFQTVKNSEAVAEIMTATDTRIIEQHYGVFVNNFAGFTYWQSYIQGYSMEQLGWSQQILWSRLWVTAKK